jgi:hypothetical protein
MSAVEMEFKQYRRKQIAELADWTPDIDMRGVSVSAEDTKAGSPKVGDKIARNPKNHADRWLVAAAYFVDNFELCSNELVHAERLDALEAENERLRQWQRDMVEIQASGGRLDGYRELADKCAAFDAKNERLRAELAKAREALYHIAITDDVDCIHANDAKALTRIAREALRDGGGNG